MDKGAVKKSFHFVGFTGKIRVSSITTMKGRMNNK